MPWNGVLSSLWNRAKLYKQPIGRLFDVGDCCFICRSLDAEGNGLCKGCVADLPRRSGPRLERRIASVDAAFAAFRYEFPITDLIKSAKFHADLGALSVLATGFSGEFVGELEESDFIVPVPLLPWRFLRRGFNQAVELANTLSAQTGYPVYHSLVWRAQVWGRAQSQLDAMARRENMRGAFRLRKSIVGARVAIVDDVITTGATCSALADILRSAGARRVIAVAAAATPLRRNGSSI